MFGIGFASRRITPGIPCTLAGYAVQRPSEGVHDDLYARALAFRNDGRMPLLILQIDILHISKVCADPIRERLSTLGLKKENILIFAIHTHSAFGEIFDTPRVGGKESLSLPAERNQALVDLVIDGACAAAEEAMTHARHDRGVSIRFLKGAVEGIGANRHDPAMACDKSLFAMEFLRSDGKRVLVYNLSCHPTVMSPANRLISADFPGAVNRLLSDRYDQIMFINGSAGDMSTRFTRRESSFAECERIGGIAAVAITALAEGDAPFEALESIRAEFRSFTLKEAEIQDCGAVAERLAEAEKNLERIRAGGTAQEIRKAESFVEGARVALRRAQAFQGAKAGEIPVDAAILRVNNRTILCSPLEVFSVLALPLKEKTGIEMFGYANTYLGYLADRAAYDNGDYEALMSRFAPGEGEHYIEQAASLFYHE
jgi:hypothetical protein